MPQTFRTTADRPFRNQGRLLHAARLAATQYNVTTAASMLEVSDSSYRAAESGRRRPSAAILAAAERCFGVTGEFLREGSPLTAQDREAHRIARALERVETDGIRTQPTDTRIRLRSFRMSMGFTSARAAAQANNWAVSSYGSHEQERAPLSIDLLFQYGKGLGIDYDLLLFDEGAGSEKYLAVVEAMRSRRGPHLFDWPWVVTGKMPILRRYRRRFRHVKNAELQVASNSIAAGAVLAYTRNGAHAHILAHPYAEFQATDDAESPSVWMICDGLDLFLEPEPRGDFLDPLLNHGTKKRPLLLGRRLQSIAI